MAKILVNGDLTSHPLIRSIPQERRMAAVDLWIQGVAWLAHQRAIQAVTIWCTDLPAGAVKEMAGRGGHRTVWDLVHAGLWLEDNGFWLQPGHASLPASPDGANPRTGCRTYEYRVMHGDPGELWRIADLDRRQPIPSGVRSYVYTRDGYACIACGSTEDLTLDHIQPWSLGGSDTPKNLQTMCRSCNSRKGARV